MSKKHCPGDQASREAVNKAQERHNEKVNETLWGSLGSLVVGCGKLSTCMYNYMHWVGTYLTKLHRDRLWDMLVCIQILHTHTLVDMHLCTPHTHTRTHTHTQTHTHTHTYTHANTPTYTHANTPTPYITCMLTPSQVCTYANTHSIGRWLREMNCCTIGRERSSVS